MKKKINQRFFFSILAGQHRTGVSVYSILRLDGETPDSALEIMEKIRPVTRKDVGQKRIDVAENLIVPILLEKLKNKQN